MTSLYKNTKIISCLVNPKWFKFLQLVALFFLVNFNSFATEYYFHPRLGNDQNTGKSRDQAFKSLKKVASLDLKGGDKLLLAGGEIFYETLDLTGKNGSVENPILIDSYYEPLSQEGKKSQIDAKGLENGILIKNSNYISVKNLKITAAGFDDSSPTGTMRIGVLISVTKDLNARGIILEKLEIEDVFYENKGFQRGKDEVRSANGTQKYGWGIRLLNSTESGMIEEVKILDCRISNLSHTGIKLTGGSNQGIRNVTISRNTVSKTGGPGIQMSGVKFVYVSENEVTYSGSNDDSRKWGRGSGLWTWGSSMVLIEKNKFMYANGPGDSAGAHIDFNCDNIVLQYNLSAYNAGGFCEILGNNYNCAYRYNISINDGFREKGKSGAFQEGKVFWLSGYQGNQKARKGPVNSYFYNNTIFVNEKHVSKIAIDNRSRGVLIANNIFHLMGGASLVEGDQYKPDDGESRQVIDVIFENNLFLKNGIWPSSAAILENKSLIGNASFSNPGGLALEDYIPLNKELVQQGITIPFIPNDDFGLMEGLNLTKDILGNQIFGTPSIGAIQVKEIQ
ncbi:right-handed parallel beta-helix repeat-containing protein [Algoriphagus pacificus]|uniref:Right-handed parallel beta-helix repeat-containing protein n=1 Tax=Algoriphagus pacificus TaxID=2811234 RepID=A0ABS3CMS6_9BACT|nr:right-handed parallel beta-helix repeat-containing protein [Algoriphagus pacificus]MBN7816954.1 right-handed parallel beta-helix repeat-containing protein [Algoriphagus pacificus]